MQLKFIAKQCKTHQETYFKIVGLDIGCHHQKGHWSQVAMRSLTCILDQVTGCTNDFPGALGLSGHPAERNLSAKNR